MARASGDGDRAHPEREQIAGGGGSLPGSVPFRSTMNPFTISKLARMFGLSRTTLLYYHRIGLLQPAGRTASGYRFYSEAERQRLERICRFRQAGLPLRDIRLLLTSPPRPMGRVLERRIREIADQILDLRQKQRLLSGMLRQVARGTRPPSVDKQLWVDMLRAAGMDDAAMRRWHREFEQRAPQAHHEFLLSLGIPEWEAQRIRGVRS